MSNPKSKNIQRLSHQLGLIDEKLKTIEVMGKNLPFLDITGYNGSGHKETISIEEKAKKELLSFSKDWYSKERENIFNEMQLELCDGCKNKPLRSTQLRE